MNNNQSGDYSFESLDEYQNIVNMIFLSEEEARLFFRGYAKLKGFGIRKDIIKKRGGMIYYRRFVCSKAGYRDEKYFGLENRQREERAITRCGCMVKFSVKLDKKNMYWYVDEFYDFHNHDLANQDQVSFLRSHRQINDSKKADIHSLEVSRLRKCQIMDVMEYQEGGFQNVGFVMKDYYNLALRQKNARIKHGDAESVLKLMKRRKEADVEFFFDFNTDSNGHLTTLFWCDSQSRIDYQCFGDVVVFDSTYRVNRYNMPFVPFVGVNHHRSTTIFGCGIVNNESAESYEWLLSTFLDAMYQVHPTSVITDGCPSMAKAIRTVLPQTTHRLCSWHIELNMGRHLHCSNFDGFRALIYNACAPEDFEKKWDYYVKSSETLESNEWLQLMYKSKERWAMAYLQNELFLGMKSNQRNESLNSRLHRHLDRNMCLLDMFEHYEHCLSRIRRNEAELDCKASQSIPVLKTEFQELEKNVALIFTPKIFYRIRHEINRANDYEIIEIEDIGDSKWYVLELKDNPGSTICVECPGGEGVENVNCTCMKLDCDRIPCSHIFRVMIEMKINVIPECCIAKRWTKNPKDFPPLQKNGFMFDWSEQYIRNREMSKLGSELFHEASRSEADYLEIMESMRKLLSYKKNKAKVEPGDSTAKQFGRTSSSFNVNDPKVTVGRGAPKKRMRSFLERRKNHCGKCGIAGHNKTTCPNYS